MNTPNGNKRYIFLNSKTTVAFFSKAASFLRLTVKGTFFAAAGTVGFSFSLHKGKYKLKSNLNLINDNDSDGSFLFLFLL